MMSVPHARRNRTSTRTAGAFRRAWQRWLSHRAAEAGWALFFAAAVSSGYAQALSIHDFRVTSRLGEPLDATIVVEALPGEQLAANCITTAGSGAGDLPAITGIRLSLTRNLSPGTIRLRTSQAVREPLGQIVLTVDCPGTPNVTRTFMVMLDPPAADEPSAPVVSQALRRPTLDRPSPVISSVARYAAASNAAQAERPRQPGSGDGRPRIRRAVAGDGSPIAPGSEYTVRNGDSLSVIAARVQGRPANSVWPIARAIHRANPGAFLLGDPNVITSGALIYIPTLEQSLGTDALVPLPSASVATNIAADPVAAPRAIAWDDDDPVSAPVSATRNSLTIPVAPAPEPTDVPTVAAAALAATARSRALVRPLETMTLSTSLSALSVNRLHLRRTGVLEVAPATAPAPAAQAPQAPQRDGESPDKAPAATVAASREAAPAPKRADGVRVGWTTLLGLLAVVLAALLGAMYLMRRQLRIAYVRDMREALRRRRYAEQLRESREGYESTDDAIVVQETATAQKTDTAVAFDEAADELAAATDFDADDDGGDTHNPTVIMPAPIVDVGDPDAPADPALTADADPLNLAFPELSPLNGGEEEVESTVEMAGPQSEGGLDLELPANLSDPALISDETMQLSLNDEQTARLAAPGDDLADDDSQELQIDAELLALDYSRQFEATHQDEPTADDGNDPTEEMPVPSVDDATDVMPAIETDDDGDMLSTELMLEEPAADDTVSLAVDAALDGIDDTVEAETVDDPEAFYHLEAEDDADSEPLAFELDEETAPTGDAADDEPLELNLEEDDKDGSKVVAFRGRD